MRDCHNETQTLTCVAWCPLPLTYQTRDTLVSQLPQVDNQMMIVHSLHPLDEGKEVNLSHYNEEENVLKNICYLALHTNCSVCFIRILCCVEGNTSWPYKRISREIWPVLKSWQRREEREFSFSNIVYHNILSCYRRTKQSSDHVNMYQDSFEHEFSVLLCTEKCTHPCIPSYTVPITSTHIMHREVE